MRRVGNPYRRPGKPGWWLRWTDPATGKRVKKNFHNKGQAEYYRGVLYQRLNSDVLPGVIDGVLSEVVKEYLATYEVRGLRSSAITEARLTLGKFAEISSILKTKAITQSAVDRFIKARLDSGASRWTVNKDIGNLHAFLAWCAKQRYIQSELQCRKVKVDRQIKKALTTEQIRALLAACPSPAWRVRILLSLCTGLRKNDLDGLPAASIDLKRMTLDAIARKTGKVFVNLPLPNALKPILRKHLSGISGQLFQDRNIRKIWDAIRIKANLPAITRQDLRVTASTLLQRIGSIGSAKTLLQHSSAKTTTEFYTDEEMILRWKVNQLPVKEWVKGIK